MFMPVYEFSAPTKSIVDTQKVMRTIKSTHIFAFVVTVLATLCDFCQLNYFTSISMNDSPLSSMTVSILVVTGLDVSMFILGISVNQYRKSKKASKKSFRFACIGLLAVFGFAYLIYILLALPVLIQQASEGAIPFYGRLLIPVGSSLLSFFASVGWNPAGQYVQLLNDEKIRIESDIASSRNTLRKIDRDSANFDAMRFEDAQAARVFDSLYAKVKETSQEARTLLAKEIGIPEAADALLTQVGLDDSFWESARAKISSSDELFPDGIPVKELSANSTAADLTNFSLDLTA